MIDEYLDELYKLYTQSPYFTYKQLSEYMLDKYNIDIQSSKIREILCNKFSNISEIKKRNRSNLEGITDRQLERLYKLRTEEDYSYEMLVKYLEEKFKIKSNYSILSKVMKEKFPDIDKKFKEHKNERYFKRQGKIITSEERKIIIELLTEGYKQSEVASLVGITQSYVSRIMKKSKVEIEEIRRARIERKLGSCTKESIINWWNEESTVGYIIKKVNENSGCIDENSTKYLLKNILGLKRKCKLCGNYIDIDNRSSYCSNKCRKEARKDSIRNQQSNRRVKGSGKTAQSVSKFKKIREAKGICYLCQEKLDIKQKDKYHPCYIVLDHVEALVYSNDSSEENLKPVCRCCNNMKSDKPKDYYTVEEYRENKRKKILEYIPKENNSDLIDTKAFINDCNNGMTMEELCKKYNRSNHIIWKLKNDLGALKKEKIHNKLNPEYATNEVARLTKEGKSIAEISEILNIAKPTVSNYRRKAILKGMLEPNLSKKNKLSNEIKNRLVYLIESGKSDEEILDILKVSKTTIYKYRKKLNL